MTEIATGFSARLEKAEAIYSDGGALRVTTEASGVIERRCIRLNAAADLPTDPTDSSLVAADQVLCNGFSTGARFVLVEAHFDPYDTAVAGVAVTVNPANAAQATARLTLNPDVAGGGTADEDSGADVVSRQNPSILYDLRGADTDVATVYLVGIAGDNGSGTFGETWITVKVW